MILRLYTGEDGQSHFEKMNMPAGAVEEVALAPGADLMFLRTPDGHFRDWHNAPRRRYVILLSGQMEVGIGDGTVLTLFPGDVVLSEDLTGQGHTIRCVNGPRVTLTAYLPDADPGTAAGG